MCRIPKVLLVAPAERHQELRRQLGSLEYDIVAAVETPDEAAGISADVAVAWEPDEDTLRRLHELSLKTVAFGGQSDTADMNIPTDDIASFKSRVWELFRPT